MGSPPCSKCGRALASPRLHAPKVILDQPVLRIRRRLVWMVVSGWFLGFPAQGLHLFQEAFLPLSKSASNTQFGLDEHYMSQQGPFICVSNPANPILGRLFVLKCVRDQTLRIIMKHYESLTFRTSRPIAAIRHASEGVHVSDRNITLSPGGARPMADAITRRRIELGIRSARSFGTETGLDYRTITSIEACRGNNVSRNTLGVIEHALTWPAGYLYALLESADVPVAEVNTVELVVPSNADADAVEKARAVAQSTFDAILRIGLVSSNTPIGTP